jgi:hypothetical protein
VIVIGPDQVRLPPHVHCRDGEQPIGPARARQFGLQRQELDIQIATGQQIANRYKTLTEPAKSGTFQHTSMSVDEHSARPSAGAPDLESASALFVAASFAAVLLQFEAPVQVPVPLPLPLALPSASQWTAGVALVAVVRGGGAAVEAIR